MWVLFFVLYGLLFFRLEIIQVFNADARIILRTLGKSRWSLMNLEGLSEQQMGKLLLIPSL